MPILSAFSNFRLIKTALFFVFILLIKGSVNAAEIRLSEFQIKENPFAKNEIAIVAIDTAGHVQERINGEFSFTVNGFAENLTFENGTAFYHHKLEKSSFMYLKHRDDFGTYARLYYIFKHDAKLDPYLISWKMLVAIPIILILIGYLFKRFLVLIVIIFIIFGYFNFHSGLSLSTFFESILDGLKNVF